MSLTESLKGKVPKAKVLTRNKLLECDDNPPAPPLRQAKTSSVLRARPGLVEDSGNAKVRKMCSSLLEVLPTQDIQRKDAVAARRGVRYDAWVNKLEEAVSDQVPVFSFLESRSIKEETRKEYQSRYTEILDFMAKESLTAAFQGSVQEVDSSLVQYVHWRSFARCDGGDGGKAVAAFMYHRPALSRLGRHNLPRTSRAVKGWKSWLHRIHDLRLHSRWSRLWLL